jgi:hypothetical protein
MREQSVAWLIAESPEMHGVYDTPEPTERKVYCQERSAWMQETYEAASHNLRVSCVLILSDRREYQGERLCRYRDKVWTVVRPYVLHTGGVELTLGEEM